MIGLLHSAILYLVRHLRVRRIVDAGCIACIELSRLGDVVVMIPALRMLRARYPSARLIVLVREQYAGLLRNARVADEIIGVNGRSIIRAVMLLRRRGVTLACSMSPATRNALTAIGGARACVGYLSPPRSLPGFLDRNPVSAAGVEAVDQEFFMENIYNRGVKVCHAIGISTEPAAEILTIDPEWERASSGVLRELDLASHSPYILMHPFSGWAYRSWPAERWHALIETILQKTNFDCVIISSAGERETIDTVAAGHERIHSAAGLPLDSLAVLMKRCTVYVGNDSGPLHLAAALGVPVIGLYGPAAPALTAPPDGNGNRIYRLLECSPCPQRRCVRPGDTCMMQIDHQSVFAAIERIIAATYGRMPERHS